MYRPVSSLSYKLILCTYAVLVNGEAVAQILDLDNAVVYVLGPDTDTVVLVLPESALNKDH